MNNINNLILDEERALYHITDSNIVNCRFDGPKDGESAIKECRNIHIVECYFNLRYPIWHTYPVTMTRSTMTEFCRAALWYCHNVKIEQSKLYGIKALRECQNIEISQCDIISKEFGWKNDDLKMVDSTLEGEYAFFDSKNLVIKNLKFVGKYSFQYCKNLTIESSYLDTKDAFWHSENVVIKDSYVKGEYLAWYAKNVTFINCTIEGTQPLCYCKNLVLKNCKMIKTDLSFENSEVNASIIGHIESIKNPLSGCIIADTIGDIIRDDQIYGCKAEIMLRKK
ncbi:MAG: DUF3737 family protein [Bacilli bacterium]